MTWLLDGNVLLALVLDSHVHHERSHVWFSTLDEDRFATCSITQGMLLRMHMRFAEDQSANAAWNTLSQLVRHSKHERWGDDLDYLDVPHRNLQGSAQVTDAWLAELARRRGGKVMTLDSGFAILHGDVAFLVPH